MAMLQGALIGLVVGLVMALVTWQKNKKRGAAVLVALESSPQEARSALDKQTDRVKTLKGADIVPQQERMAALAVIGDTDAILSELEGHDGKLNIISQVHGIALLGARVRGVSEATPRLNELATRMETEGGRMMGLVKTKVRAYADLAAAIDGARLPVESKRSVDTMIKNESPMLKLVVQAGLAMAIEAAGGNAEAQRAQLRESTRAFD